MKQTLNVKELKIDIENKFSKSVSSSDFDILSISIRNRGGANIAFVLQQNTIQTALYLI